MDISIMPLYCYIIYLLQCFDSFSLSSMSLFLCLSFSSSSHSTYYYYFFYVSLLIDLYSSELCLKLIRMVFFLLWSRFVFFLYPFKIKSCNFLPFFLSVRFLCVILNRLSSCFFFLLIHSLFWFLLHFHVNIANTMCTWQFQCK